MEQVMVSRMTAGVAVMLGAVFLMFPRIARRGLLFGVYVGEEAAEGSEAHRLKGRWTRVMLMWLAFALVTQWVVTKWGGPLAAQTATLLVLFGGYWLEYVKSHRAARALAATTPPPAAVAYVTPSRASRPLLAYGALVVCIGIAVLTMGYTWAHLADIPDRVAVHFNAAGRPDAYAVRSFVSVWLLPLMTLVLGTTLPLFAVLVAKAKRAVRRDDGGVSLAAQERFRAATSGWLALVALLTTALLATISVGAVRVTIGAASRLPSLVLMAAILMMAVAIGGAAFLGLRFGQGGARLEAGADAAPLTDGLADNRRWVLGIFYVNRDDPSFFVEHRFGLGYTINLGNWKAVAVLVAFVVLMLGLAIGPLLAR
jgi:uncharacterized membrane protein